MHQKLKAATTNSLSLRSILSKNTRLIIVTGKGGVGKSTLAMAITQAIKEKGKKVFYNSFDQPVNHSLLTDLKIPHFELELESSARTYMAKKLGSETIAGWILKTPFFNSLFHMLPGLGHMILLGNIINKLEEDPELTIVLDSPSSGHAITMMESPGNFKEMFRTGLIVNDIDRMEDFIFKDERMKVVITALPTAMAVQEAKDLKTELNKRKAQNFEMVINDLLCLSPSLEEVTEEDLPSFIKKRCEMENELLKDHEEGWSKIPHYAHQNSEGIVTDIANLLRGEK